MSRPVSESVLDTAIAWQLSKSSGSETRADAFARQAWLKSHPDHARAWQQLGELDAQLQVAQGNALRATLIRQGKPARGKQFAGVLALALFMFGGLALYNQQQPLAGMLADYHTATGERRRVVLPDNTVIHLNTRTAVDLAFNAEQRAIVLRDGEVEIETAHGDASERRPFLVLTEQGSLRALGTRFVVRELDDGGTMLTVTESAVLARPATCDADDCLQAGRIAQGSTVVMRKDGLSTITPARPDLDAWKDGMLVVENMRLADVAAELSRYRTGRIAVDADVADLRVTGTFPLADSDYALASLTVALPVRLQSFSRFWVGIKAE